MSESEEIAKAVQESAKLGVKGLETAEKAGSFFAKIFQQPAYEISGMITDKLRFLRWARAIKMMDEVTQILNERGIQNPRSVPPKIALPIFEEASLEDELTLQNLWNHLLANAMDPSFNDEIRYGFIDMIKNLTALEAQFLHYFYETLLKDHKLDNFDEIMSCPLAKAVIMDKFKIDSDIYAISVNNLMRLQLCTSAIIKYPFAMLDDEPMTVSKGIDAITITHMGIKFVEACMR